MRPNAALVNTPARRRLQSRPEPNHQRKQVPASPLFLPHLSERGPEMRRIGKVRPVSRAATQEINLGKY